MFVCNCNPFGDDKAETFLKNKAGELVTMREIYKECTGGMNPKCGIACVPRLREMVRNHNRAANDSAVFMPLETFSNEPG
jgi:bacterioferritin-associated ferredoxin